MSAPAMPKPKPPSAEELRANKAFYVNWRATPAKKPPESAETEQAARVASAGQKLRAAAARSFEVRASVVRPGATPAPSAPSGDAARPMDVDAELAVDEAGADGPRPRPATADTHTADDGHLAEVLQFRLYEDGAPVEGPAPRPTWQVVGRESERFENDVRQQQCWLAVALQLLLYLRSINDTLRTGSEAIVEALYESGPGRLSPEGLLQWIHHWLVDG